MISLIENELKKIFSKKSIYITLAITLVFIIACNIIYKVNENSSYGYDLSDNIEYYEQQLEALDVDDPEERYMYISYEIELEISKLVQKYGDSSTWQAQVIYETGRSYIEDMVYAKYDEINSYNVQQSTENSSNQDSAETTEEYLGTTQNNQGTTDQDYLDTTQSNQGITEQEYLNEVEQDYEDFVAKLDAGDWQYFANEQLKQVNENIEQQKQAKENTQDSVVLSGIEDQLYTFELQKQALEWRLEKDIPYGYDYFNQCLDQYKIAKVNIRDYENSSTSQQENYNAKQEYYDYLETAAISQYDIEHKTTSGLSSDARGMLLDSCSQFELFIIIMIIMVAGAIVSEEFSRGTIKLLLIKPYKRTTILASKWITCIIMLIIIIVTVMLMQFVAGGIIQGFDKFGTPAVVYDHTTNQIQEINLISYLVMQALGKLPIYIALMTLAFALSTIFTNTALAITIALLGYMGAPFVNAIGLQFNLDWIRYFITPNWDFTQYFFGGLPSFEGITPIFSIVIVLIYMLVMLIPTFVVFKKKNIKNI